MASPSDPTPRLCVITGVPGIGKTAVTDWLRHRLPGGWTILRGDDFIGVTRACYPGRDWEHVRGLHAYFAGWSAGGYLAMGRGVLLEGVFLDAEEIDRLDRATRQMHPTARAPTVVRLAGDLDEITRRLAENEDREPQWTGPDREARIRAWIDSFADELRDRATVVDTRGKSVEEVARQAASALGLPVRE